MHERVSCIMQLIQACTGIEDLGIAIMHLEEANWVLVVSNGETPDLHCILMALF